MEVMGHRGAAGVAPENTIPGIEICCKLGVPWVELDVRLTKEGELVVFHDKSLERTTGFKGEVNLLTVEEIRKLDAGSSFSKDFAGVQVPTLAEVLERFHDQIDFNIEIKDGEDRVKEQIARLFELLDKYQLRHRAVITSFRENVLRMLREEDERVRLGILANQSTEQMRKIAQEVKCEFLNPSMKVLSDSLVKWAHERDKKIAAYTANEPEIVHLFAQVEVDYVITDFPEMALECIEDSL